MKKDIAQSSKSVTLLLILLFSSASLFTIQSFAQNGRKPIIGISSTMGGGTAASAPLTYVKSVIRAGGVPLVLPITNDPELISRMLESIDGLIMTGGEDIDPLKWFGEEPVRALGEIAPTRDEFDIALIRMAVAKGLPVFGICRGEQLMNVAFGGTLYQDIPSQAKGTFVKHSQDAPGTYGTHSIIIEGGSVLNIQTGLDSTAVNTFHHQAVKQIAPGFKVTARSKDGIVEAIEKMTLEKGGEVKVFGVQFHPEVFTANGDDKFLGLFRYIVEQAKK